MGLMARQWLDFISCSGIVGDTNISEWYCKWILCEILVRCCFKSEFACFWQTLQWCLLFCLSFYFLGTELPLFFGSKSPPLHSWRGLLRTKIFLTALNFCFYIRLNYFQCLQVLYCWSGTYYWRHFLTFSSRELNTLIQIVVVLRCCYLYTCICKTRQRLNIV